MEERTTDPGHGGAKLCNGDGIEVDIHLKTYHQTFYVKINFSNV